MFRSLTQLAADTGRPIVTAHRGASYEWPENTLPAFERSVAAGADMIEFDVRATADHVPVILHDDTVDRTANGTGRPEDMTLAEIRKLNFSHYRRDTRTETPFCDRLEIPTFEEVIVAFRDRVCMNVQLYLKDEAGLAACIDLFRRYDLADRAYFTVYPALGERVRAMAPEIELCFTPGWEDRATPDVLRNCRDWGCRFVQPVWTAVSAATFRRCRELGLVTNVFFCDDAVKAEEMLAMGADGFLTNRVETLRPETGRRPAPPAV